MYDKRGDHEEGGRSKWKEGMGNKDEREVAEGLVAVSSGVGDQAQAEPSENATGMPPTLLILRLMTKKTGKATNTFVLGQGHTESCKDWHFPDGVNLLNTFKSHWQTVSRSNLFFRFIVWISL